MISIDTETSGPKDCNGLACLSAHTISRTTVCGALELTHGVAFHTLPHCTIPQISNVAPSFSYDNIYYDIYMSSHSIESIANHKPPIVIANLNIHFGFGTMLQTKLSLKYKPSALPPWPFEDLFPPPKSCTCTITPLRKLLRTCAQGGWETKAIVGYGVGETQPFQRCFYGHHRLFRARCV